MNKDYPKWIDEYSRAMHNAFKNMVPIRWEPLDYLTFTGFYADEFIDRIYLAISKLKKKKTSKKQLSNLFVDPSSLRTSLHYLIVHYMNSKKREKYKITTILEFLINILNSMTWKDNFAYKSNLRYDNKEIKKIIKKIKFGNADEKIARQIGKLYNSLSSYVFGIYLDFFPQFGNEVYGPYDVSEYFGKGHILVIKHFKELRPYEIWKDSKEFKFNEIKMFLVYKNVDFRMELIGMHYIPKGNLINGLKFFSILVDGKEIKDIKKIKELIDYIANFAFKQAIKHSKIRIEGWKRIFVYLEFYHYKKIFEATDLNWKPTKKILKAIKNKKLGGETIIKDFPSYSKYLKDKKYEPYWLRQIYSD